MTRAAQKLTNAIENVAHTVNLNRAEILEALRAAGQREVAQELTEALEAWSAASNELVAATIQEAK